MTISPQKEAQIKSLVSKILHADGWKERDYAIEDLANLLGVHSRDEFIGIPCMNPPKPRCDVAALEAAIHDPARRCYNG